MEIGSGLTHASIQVGDQHVKFPVKCHGELRIVEVALGGPGPFYRGGEDLIKEDCGVYYQVWGDFSIEIPKGIYVLTHGFYGEPNASVVVQVGDEVEVSKEGDSNNGREGPVVDIVWEGEVSPVAEVWFEDGRKRYGPEHLKHTGRAKTMDEVESLPSVPLVND